MTRLPLHEVKPSTVPGGEHEAVIARDGTATVLNVPIFCEFVVTAEGKEVRLTKQWMLAALRAAQERERDDDYLPPLHINHHDTGRDVDPAGWYRLRDVRLAEYEGELLWTMFADLIVHGEIYESKVRRSRLPYRSVEIHDVRKAEIDSLALMADEVPFYRLQLLTIGSEREIGLAREIAAPLTSAPVPLAMRSLGDHGVSFLFGPRRSAELMLARMLRGWPWQVAAGSASVMLAEFTPSEQACIGRKISELDDEGVTGDQAVAIAIDHCAPEKVKT